MKKPSPFELQKIYLDNSTITRPSTKGVHEMLPFLTERWGSFAAPHHQGQEGMAALAKSYQALYRLVGAANRHSLVLTSSGAEAVNQAVFSTYEEITMKTGKNHFLTSTTEEAPALMAMSRMEKWGCSAKRVPTDSHGVVSAAAVAESLTPRTAMMSLSWANGLTGVVQPMAEIAIICQKRGVRLQVDASHVLGKLFFEFDEAGPDLLTFEGTCFHALKGTGGLFAKEGIQLEPLIAGGVEQAGWRAGPVDVPGAVALGVAAEEAMETRDLFTMEVARLRNLLEQGIQLGFPEAHVFFQDQERLPHCTAIAFPGISNEALLFFLNQKGVYASIGGGHFQQLSLILEACGVPPLLAQTAVSFSLSRETTEKDIEIAVERIVEAAKQLRKLSLKDRLLPPLSS